MSRIYVPCQEDNDKKEESLEKAQKTLSIMVVMITKTMMLMFMVASKDSVAW